MKLKNLEKVLKKLNKTDEDGFKEFNFTMREEIGNEEGQILLIYDKNEVYYYEYAYNNFLTLCDCADEFGCEKPTSYDDEIFVQIENALKLDGYKGILDWYDDISLIVNLDEFSETNELSV